MAHHDNSHIMHLAILAILLLMVPVLVTALKNQAVKESQAREVKGSEFTIDSNNLGY